jgi:LPXTG-site transpeptidase (sortase) family protein
LTGDGDYDDEDEVSVVAASRIWGTMPVTNPVTPPISLVNPQLPETGFAPNRVTLLDVESKANTYSSTGGIVLEIPRLDVETEILGVPLNIKAGSWDVTWLANQVGWLNGTAYPSASGNSVLTAHVYLPSGKPGPFVSLGTLKWGDQIVLHANGHRYVYEVREVKLVLPGNISAFKHEEKAWLTLVTCQGYNEKTDTYNWRRLVRAVLVSVTAE